MMLTDSDLASVFDRIRKGALGIVYDVTANGIYEMPPNMPVLGSDHMIGTLNDMEKAFFSTAKILERDLLLIGKLENEKKPNGMDFLRSRIAADLNMVYECLIRSVQDRFGLSGDFCYGIAIRRGYTIVLLPFAREKIPVVSIDTSGIHT